MDYQTEGVCQMMGIGYKDSHSQTKIPKYSPTFKSWCRGNFKPMSYKGLIWIVTIEYFDTYEERNEPTVFNQGFMYQHRHYAVEQREIVLKSLHLEGKTVLNHRIRLVRV